MSRHKVHGRLTSLDVGLWYMAHRLPQQGRNPLVDLLEAVQPHRWMADATCATADPDAWFPRRGAYDSTTQRALYVCNRVCPVRQECLAYAVTTPDPPQGIWGGTTEHQRRALRQKRERA